ncbi:putative ribonuclease H-like domain-containing protein [Tanacetum coccineum]
MKVLPQKTMQFTKGHPQKKIKAMFTVDAQVHMQGTMSPISQTSRTLDRGYLPLEEEPRRKLLVTLDESMLWHRRLGHGKQHKASCKSKIQNSITQPLFVLHIDLFGPTFVSSLMNKKYCLVVTDDYSRFNWVFFLETKDETSGILKRFITKRENLVDKKVNIIRCDNRTEFKNKVMSEFCEQKCIKRKFSVARTPQQNGVAERRNRTLIEAIRTMLADSKLPTIFWAEAVNTACYVQNMVLVVKPHNKTPYELFRGRTPALRFMRPFGCHVTVLNTLDYLGKFDGKSDEGFFVGYSMNSKAFRVYNIKTRKVKENLHTRFLEDKPIIAGDGPKWLFDIDVLTKSMNYVSVIASTNSNDLVGTKESIGEDHFSKETRSSQDYILMPLWKDGSLFDYSLKNASNDEPQPSSDAKKKGNEDVCKESGIADQEKPKNSTQGVNTTKSSINTKPDMFSLEDNATATHADFFGNETEVDMSNITTTYPVPSTPNTRIHKDHLLDHVIGDIQSSVLTRIMTKTTNEQRFISAVYEGKTYEDLHTCLFACFLSQEELKKVIQALKDPTWIEAIQEELLQFKIQQVWTLVDLPHGKRAIGTKWVYKNKKDERVARIEEIKIFLAYASFKDFVVYQMDVKSAFLDGKIEEEVYVCQPPGFENLEFHNRVYKVEKALYGLHQAPRAWYETLSTYLLDNGFQRCQIDKTLFIKRVKSDILLKLQMSSMGELTFFLGLQVTQKDDGIFISQDKYVDEILKKFGFSTVKTTSTPMETLKPLLKDAEIKDVDVHLYRSMIGSVMYLTSSRPDIMFVVCACARFQVTHKVSHLHAVKRIFRYLKGQPKFGLWYPKDSPFDLEAYTDSDYAGASLDRKSTIGVLATAKAKTVNGEVQIQALEYGKKVIVTETSVRRALQLKDAEGTECLPNATIFAELERMRITTALTKVSTAQLKLLLLNIRIKTANVRFNSDYGNLFQTSSPSETTNVDGFLNFSIPGLSYEEKYKDAQTLFAAIQTRFGGNEATKKTQKTLLKQMYENFSASSTESLDFIFNRLQKINTYVVVWRNKPDLDTMGFNDLYKNFKIVEQEVKGTTNPISSLNSQNMVFISSPRNTNEVDTAYRVSTANTPVSTASTQVSTTSSQVSTANLSDATVYAFLANQPSGARRFFQKTGRKITINGSDTAGYDKSKVECFNCHKMGHFARECRGPRNHDSRNMNQDNSRRKVYVEDTFSKAMVAIDEAGFDWSYMADDEVLSNMALMAFSGSEGKKGDSEISVLKSELEKLKQEKEINQLKIDKFENASKSLDKLIRSQITNNIRKGSEEFQQPEFEGYEPKPSKNVSKVISTEVRESTDTPLVEKLVSDDKLEKKTNFPTVAKKEFIKGNQQENPVRKIVKYASMYRLTASQHKGKRMGFGNDYSQVVNTARPNSAVVNVVRANLVNAVKASKDDDGVRKESRIDDQERIENSAQDINTVGQSVNTAIVNVNTDHPTLEATHDDLFGDETEVDMSNITTTYPVPSTPNTRIHKDHSLDHEEPKRVAKALSDPAWVEAMQEELL